MFSARPLHVCTFLGSTWLLSMAVTFYGGYFLWRLLSIAVINCCIKAMFVKVRCMAPSHAHAKMNDNILWHTNKGDAQSKYY